MARRRRKNPKTTTLVLVAAGAYVAVGLYRTWKQGGFTDAAPTSDAAMHVLLWPKYLSQPSGAAPASDGGDQPAEVVMSGYSGVRAFAPARRRL